MLTQAAREAVSMSKLINFSSFLRCLLGDENYRLSLVFLPWLFVVGHGQLVAGSLVHQPQRVLGARADELGGQLAWLVRPFQHILQYLGLIGARHQEHHLLSLVDERGGEGEAIHA